MNWYLYKVTCIFSYLMQDSPETDITCESIILTAGHLFIKLDLYIRVVGEGMSYQNIYFNKTQFNTTMKNLVKFPQMCRISYATIFNIINKSNLIPFLMRIQLALLFSFHSLESLSPSATSAVTAISDNNPFKYTYVPIFSLFILYM